MYGRGNEKPGISCESANYGEQIDASMMSIRCAINELLVSYFYVEQPAIGLHIYRVGEKSRTKRINN